MRGFLVALFFLGACKTQYQVGECFQLQQGNVDPWEFQVPIERVQQIGGRSYRTCWIVDSDVLVTKGSVERGPWMWTFYSTVSCPEKLVERCLGK